MKVDGPRGWKQWEIEAVTVSKLILRSLACGARVSAGEWHKGCHIHKQTVVWQARHQTDLMSFLLKAFICFSGTRTPYEHLYVFTRK